MLCQSEKQFSPDTQFQVIKAHYAFHTVSMDLIGPLPVSSQGVKYIFVAIYHLTKWVKARAINNLGATTISKFVLEQII